MNFVGSVRANLRLATFTGYCGVALGRYELARKTIPQEKEKEIALLHQSMQIVSRRILAILGVVPQIHGTYPTTQKARLIVANHRAALDIGVILSHVPTQFLSREDLSRWPILGRMARHANTIFVDRQSSRSGASAIRAIRRALKEGQNVVAFPEGATFRGDEVRPFSAGAFAAARGLDVEVVPMGFVYPSYAEYVGIDFLSHLQQVSAQKTTPVVLTIGQPFPIGKRTSQSAATEAQTRVQDLVGTSRLYYEKMRFSRSDDTCSSVGSSALIE